MTNINTESNNIEHYYEQANMLSERNDYEEAIELFDKVIELDPNHFEAYYNKGYALEGLGYTSGDINKFLEAIKAYDRAIEIKPDYTIAYQAKGILWKTIGDIESRKAFGEFYKLRPDRRKLSATQDEQEINKRICKLSSVNSLFTYHPQ
ncbi:MAG TPA: tetratricopeptide repeat protein [Rickettsia endosymbiont of Omalisus fontisbellaquei]|nr:tetratricopeptide repeat protein [Rickettsia endosymbiont of Omalisus fontisbellaquei]